MHKSVVAVFVFLLSLFSFAQSENLLDDFRQHNLTNINSSLLNPTFSYDRNNPRSVAIWTRWQWQTPDTDPTTIFLNYTQQLGSQVSGGIGFFQNNTPLFQNTGGIVNFAFSIPLDQEGRSNLYFGSNVSLFQQEATNDSIAATIGNSFVGQFTPGVRVQVAGFNLGFSVENALNFDFSDSERDETGRVFGGLASYDFPISLFGEGSYIRPQAYVRSFPEADTQYGLAGLLQHPKFWVQAGYNSFYGASGGLGTTLFDNLSIGALVEFGLDDVVRNEDPTFEILVAYHFGKQQYETVEDDPEVEEERVEEEEKKAEEEKEKVEEEKDNEPKLSRREQRRLERERNEQEKIREQTYIDSVQRAQENQRWEEWNKQNNDSIARVEEEKRMETLRKIKEDSIAQARKEQIRKELEKARQDSIARLAATKKEEQPKPNERYQEVSSEEGLQPGYYLIANVFGTKRYYEAFMAKLDDEGLEPKSFYRSVNRFNYVYLRRYNSLSEARAARNSGLNGKYSGELWVFRVR